MKMVEHTDSNDVGAMNLQVKKDLETYKQKLNGKILICLYLSFIYLLIFISLDK